MATLLSVGLEWLAHEYNYIERAPAAISMKLHNAGRGSYISNEGSSGTFKEEYEDEPVALMPSTTNNGY
jgi:hypothetical protein